MKDKEGIKVDKELILHVAHVARLKLSEHEVEKFVPQVKDILDAFSEIDKADVSGVKPSYQPVEIKDVMRDDTTKECLTQEQALANSKFTKDGYFKGPGVGNA
jgi:aspartyl-tRNA(Asn)/glutamyl-tRNA(Gln) amidotransferase subunit C